jgi:hypothetical protein
MQFETHKDKDFTNWPEVLIQKCCMTHYRPENRVDR